ncbi:MAG TPA: DUF4340 domain-containing protein [Pirellulaceae bacterium]|nr:DUF4340 domain-containing protein [Pirellulaceae bacterium]HMO91038.1 DUF4340 domain-containing protein [Pirellulaceae bacterium]HMP68153.1 DUF4340 domain-containing protein [Pirellulaceae bacterium]
MRTTLIMFIIATVMVVLALRLYPWPIQQNLANKINEPLFPEYSSSDVKSIQIETFVFVDAAQGVVERFIINQRGNEWFIPSRANFPAQNVARLAEATSCLNDLKIEDLTSEDQKDYGLYGVHEPDSDAVGGKGTRFSLLAANAEPIASIVVGESPEGRPDQKYVRVSGQPQVYLVTFDEKVLSTELSSWVDPNLFRMSQEDARNIKYIEIDNYSADPDNFATSGKIKHNYRVRIDFAVQSSQPQATLIKADPAGKLEDEPIALTLPSQQPNWLTDVLLRLGSIPFNNIRPKQDLVAKYLAEQTANVQPLEFSSMLNSGFYYRGRENEQHQFLAIGGSLSLGKGNGSRLTMNFGRLSELQRGSTEVTRYAFLSAELDASLLPEPEPIETDDPAEQRNYERDLRQWNEAMDRAKRAVADFNLVHSKWYYLIPEGEYERLMPAIDRLQIGQ